MILCPLVDRWGGRSGFLGALIGVTVFSLCGALAPSWGALTLIYAFNRFCGAAAWASMVKQAPPWFGEKNHGLVLGVLSLSYVFGGAAGIACAGQISEWTGHSWRAIFGLPSFALLFIIGLAAWLLPRALRAPHTNGKGPTGFNWRLARTLVASPSFWAVCALSFALTLLRETFNDWTVDFIKTEGGAGLSNRVAAFLSTPFDLCGAAGILVAGMMVGRFPAKTQRWILVSGLGLLCGALIALPHLIPFGLAAIVLGIGLIGFLSLGPYSLLAGYFSVRLQGPACAATVAGLVDSIGYFAGIVAGSTFGWLLHCGGYTLGLQVLAVINLVSAGRCFFWNLNHLTEDELR
ncbi:MAG: Regulatory protein UhpC [Verrucomicrobiota bacterium]|jgi:sugar phosphate permease